MGADGSMSIPDFDIERIGITNRPTLTQLVGRQGVGWGPSILKVLFGAGVYAAAGWAIARFGLHNVKASWIALGGGGLVGGAVFMMAMGVNSWLKGQQEEDFEQAAETDVDAFNNYKEEVSKRINSQNVLLQNDDEKTSQSKEATESESAVAELGDERAQTNK